jgi:hypothetical protein
VVMGVVVVRGSTEQGHRRRTARAAHHGGRRRAWRAEPTAAAHEARRRVPGAAAAAAGKTAVDVHVVHFLFETTALRPVDAFFFLHEAELFLSIIGEDYFKTRRKWKEEI